MSNDMWDIPTEVHVTPVPLIGFVGLHTEAEIGDGDHRKKLWDLFSSNRGMERHALNFRDLDLDKMELPVAKTPRTSYEGYHPGGILKRNWISKHISQLPSVIVLFISNPTLEIVSSEVQKVRQALSGVRQTKLVVVLLQDVADQVRF